MKSHLFVLLFIISCREPNDSVKHKIQYFTIESTDTSLHNINGDWILKGKPYIGYVIEKKEGKIISKLLIKEGNENGIAYGWYPNGKKKYQRSFVAGNREGIQKGWYENDTLSFQYFFKNDLYEGEQLTFFKNGKPWQSLHYVKGYEEGKQKSWNDSGRVINNFTIKNGKLYGVIGRFDCMSVFKK